MSDPQEPKNLVLVKLDQVLARLDNLHEDMRQIKARMTALEKQMQVTGESVVAQWDTFDKHGERLTKLEEKVR
jgi:peptidoglycan hydrolase CwlO-like protein